MFDSEVNLEKLDRIMGNIDAIIRMNPVARKRMAEIEARADQEEAEQLADEKEMQMRYRNQQ